MTPETSRHPHKYAWRQRFPNTAQVLRGEGGTVYAAEDDDGKSVWVIKDEGALADFLADEDRAGLISLTRYSTRERGRCVADLAELRIRHRAGSISSAAASERSSIQALVGLTDEIAAHLGRLAVDRQLQEVNERDHLQPSCAAAAHALALQLEEVTEVSTQLQVDFPAWPRLGNVDVSIGLADKLPALLELKCGSGTNALGQCVWDAAKLAFAMQCDAGSAAFLLAAVPVRDWERPIRGAEFFTAGPHDVALVRVLYGDWWREWEKRGDPQPSELPRSWWTEPLHRAPFAVAGTAWELRIAQVLADDDERVPWPRLTPRRSRA